MPHTASFARAADGLSDGDSPEVSPAPSLLFVSFLVCALTYYLARFLTDSQAQRFPAGLLSVTALIAGHLLTYSGRFSTASPLCPKNWALILFTVQLLVMPLLLISLGPVRGVLPYLPSDASINAAMLINVLAYISFLVGMGISRKLVRSRVSMPPAPGSRPVEASSVLVVTFALLGVIGLTFRFQSISNLFGYFVGQSDLPQILLNQGDARSSLQQAAAIFLSGALGFAFVLIACRLIERLKREGSAATAARWLPLLAVVGLAALSYGVYLYNRGAVLVPALALGAAISLRYRRISFRMWAVAGVIIVVLALQFGNLRNTYLHPQAVSIDYNQQIQVYGSAPQFTAFMLEQDLENLRLYPGETLVSSLLYPVPAIGRAFRASSGVALYNGLIYGFSGTTDQVVPFEGELFWNLGLPGVAVGFVALGMAVGWLQKRFEKAPSALAAYMVQYVSTWLGFLIVGSVAVLSQIVIYFMWPFLLVILLNLARHARNG